MDLRNKTALALVRARLSDVEAQLEAAEEKAYATFMEKHELEVKYAVVMERLDLLTSGVLDKKDSAPQTWTEDVEDAEYLFRTGRLDRSEFEAALEAAGFANTEIEFESGSLPRI